MIPLIKSLDVARVTSFYENIDLVFEEIVKTVKGNCGILVLKENSESYAELASFGYESDFYYSFLIRGKGSFEAIANSTEPVIFESKDYHLHLSNSIFAAGVKVVYKEKILGFLFVEFAENLSPLQLVFLEMIAEKIAYLHAHRMSLIDPGENEVLSNPDKNICYEVFDFILRESIGFANSLKANRFINIQGGPGSGKKSLVKFIYKKLDLNGKIIYLNSLPEQFGKLEKAIQDWIGLVGNGILVIESISRLTLGQQRVFFEFIKEPILEPRIIFLDDLTRHKEDYQPFWNLLTQHTIQLPNLLSLDTQSLRSLIDILFKNLRQINRRPEMMLSEDAYDFLLNYPYKENLRDLRNILEQTVITSKENIINKEFYLKINNSKIKSLDFQNEEDLDLRKSVQALERQKILLANKIFSGNQIRMAKALGVSRGSLQYKMKQLEL